MVKIKRTDYLNDYYTKYFKMSDFFIKKQENLLYIQQMIKLIKLTRKKGKTIFLIGNGGSSAIAEHIAVDFVKNAKIHAMTISGTPMLTTLSNDYGFENIFKKGIESFGRKDDLLIAISSSGTSKNILNACYSAKKNKLKIITFSGFKKDNPLSKLGDINLWVDSCVFGFLENFHCFLLHWIVDSIIGNKIYKGIKL